MFNFFAEVRVLRQEGKLHKKLISRVRALFGISLMLAAIFAFDISTESVNLLIALALAIIGFFFGLYVFSRINVVNWNEEKEVLQTGKMDKVGYISLGLYIILEIIFRTFLQDFFPLSATVLLLAGICGTIFGRAFGTVLTIHKVFKSTHPSSEFA